jgi:UDP-N-acetylmuramoyl-L-alanyl-D-glutamate--2,6-diaminopimelate ligase
MERYLSEFLTEEIIAEAGLTKSHDGEDPLITALEYDSRKVQPGSLFFALPGLHTDGHNYINNAVTKGAVAVVHEAEVPEKKPGVTYFKAKNSRFAMSPVAAAFYGFPSHKLLVAGVTGTEGKSTTVYLIWQILRLMGKKAGFISTVQYSFGGDAQSNPEHQTTPEATIVQRLLWEMVNNGCVYAIVESSSHGLSPKTNRLGNVEFDAAVLTNVTHEHLEFHGSWEQYRDDKANLFRALNRQQEKTEIKGIVATPDPFGVINTDDNSAAYFDSVTVRETRSFSTNGKDATLTVRAIESSTYGNWYSVFIAADNTEFNIRDQLPGKFNAGNILAALLIVSGLTGISVKRIATLCPRLLPVRGRMTLIDKGQPFELLVDYAHTPSSFQTIFPPLRKQINCKKGRIISVFGSAGERDIKKRQEQGKIAAAYSDIIILTDEDPRGEQAIGILEEIAKGVYAQGINAQGTDTQGIVAKNPGLFIRDENLYLIPDRPAAIRKALSLAHAGDLVLLLGKSHENSIIYKDHVMPYDEITEAEKALGELMSL